MNPSDLGRLSRPSDSRISPDGSRIVFVVSRPDPGHDRYDRTLHVSDSSGTRTLTHGPADSMPRWSPDGTRIAFLRASGEKGSRSQVAVIDPTGGEARIVSDFSLGVETIRWSPDGSRLAVLALEWEPEWEGLDDDERLRRPKRVQRFPYRFDNRGWLHDRRRQVWLVDPSGDNEARLVSPDDRDCARPEWSPDGRHVVYLADRSPLGLERGTDVVEVDVETTRSRTMVPRGLWMAASYRPDGTLHLLGDPGLDWPVVATFHRMEADGSLTSLTDRLDRSHVSLAAGPPVIEWVGDVAHLGLEDSGTMGVVAVHPDGRVDHLVEGPRLVAGFSMSDDGERLAFVSSEPTVPGLVMVTEAGEESLVADPMTGVDLELVEPDHFRVTSDVAEIDTWVLLPPGEGPVPVLLNIHGGPASQYGFGFFDEFQVYAGAGFGVVACNPRGSSGRGSHFLRAVVGDGWGTVDLADVTAALDAALERHPRLDPDRMGIMGGSYGGFLTAWTIARDHRFRSAVVERALLSFPSFAGTSDIGATFPRSYTAADYPDGWGSWWEKSPLAHADRISTPTLILHSENDFRCPVEQAEQLFMALARSGTDVEMVRFPGEGHELSRSGSPRHRVERFEAILDWHSRHLAGSGPDTAG